MQEKMQSDKVDNNSYIKSNKKKYRIKEILALSVVALGILLLIVSFLLESYGYPWQLLFGVRIQSEASIPDPGPLVPDEEDINITVSDDLSLIDTDGTVDINGDDILPGDEEATIKTSPPQTFVVIGTFKIPTLRISQNLLEGTDRQLKYGVGHLVGSAMPEQKGNFVVAGHRSYPFRHVNKLKNGDNIIIKSSGITYTYSVFEKFEVLPDETWVLKIVDGEDYVLTIITCTPYIVSSHRLIVRARLTDVNGKPLGQ